MKCLHPLLAVWHKPDSNYTWLMDKPRILGAYSQRAEGGNVAVAAGLPMWSAPFLDYILLPCGQCLSCRLRRSSEWSYRCMVERALRPANCCITLTVDDDHLQEIFPGGSLVYNPFQLFMKRLRKELSSRLKLSDGTLISSSYRVRFLMCGEYGSMMQRPHYHALIFGFDFPDKELFFVRDGYPVYRSRTLSSLWPYGFSTVIDMVDDAVAYVCRYVLKKVTGACSEGYYNGLAPEFVKMSLRPGIGSEFFWDYVGKDFYKLGQDGRFVNDYVEFRGHRLKLPRYFDKLYERCNNVDYVSLKNFRLEQCAPIFSLLDSDLSREEDYLNEVTKGRINHGDF